MQNSTHSVWRFWVFPQQKAVFIAQQQHPGQRTQWRAMNLLPLYSIQSSWMYNFYLNNISQGINSSLSLIILFLFSSLFLNLFLNFHFLSIQPQFQRQRLVVRSFPELWHSYVLSSSSLWNRGFSRGAQQEQVKALVLGPSDPSTIRAKATSPDMAWISSLRKKEITYGTRNLQQ